ncbi:GNAT family N-acetyltransferase [Planctomonas psychrotolerans]|uniref:GNAT family N-acetyltransferase n=1 Tax=Planctomonas psychrotolerans TaxID=2528712 RepID=UPI00123C0A91|nr:GNAT family N-acetyltransferase [Planctomonas psychrotolerans]
MHIRAYASRDALATAAVFRRAVRATAGAGYTAAQAAAWAPDDRDPERWAKRRGSRPTWVAVEEDRVIGFTDLLPHGHVDMMFVAPDAQGRGVASALLETVLASTELAEARLRGVHALTTDASIPARPFFERHGFVVVASRDVPLRGQVLRNYRMRLDLPDDF